MTTTRSSLPRRIAGPLVAAGTYRELAFHAAGLLLSSAWFCLLLAGWLATALLAVTPLVMPVLVGFRALTRWSAAIERGLARSLLGIEIATPAPRAERTGFWTRAGNVLSDPRFWKEQAFLLQRTVLGFAFGLGLLVALAVSVGLLALPAYYWTGGGPDLGSWETDTLSRALLLALAGAAGLIVWPHLVRLATVVESVAAQRLLGPSPANAALARRLRRQGVAIHAAAALTVTATLVVVWAATTRGTFWPVWVILPLALLLSVHAWVVAVLGRVRRRRLQAFAIHAGVLGLVWLFLVGIWAVTSGPFWPAWSLIGLGSPVLLHLASLKLIGERSALTERIETLAQTRAGAVHESEAALRRIERDLHDGAQARLVALGMSLGMAEQKLADDPGLARELVAEARAGVGSALQELRDLARGIHPPILADRGLEAAVANLADVSPLDVAVRSAGIARPPAAVETAAYFVVAESLTNAAKHADARHASVRIGFDGEQLEVEVEDDGHGGASFTGSGLTGLRRRVEALDGTLTVDSPAGGPTIVRAVIPCAS
jgi:signal transduction histidine kinase